MNERTNERERKRRSGGTKFDCVSTEVRMLLLFLTASLSQILPVCLPVCLSPSLAVVIFVCNNIAIPTSPTLYLFSYLHLPILLSLFRWVFV